MFTELGGKVVAVACWDNEDKVSYTYQKKEGLSMNMLLEITDSFGCINKKKAAAAGCKILPGEEWIEQDVDILMPAALENQITAKNVNKISKQVKVLLEGANGPTTTDADDIIKERGIFLLPDFLANAGGVTCSYFEQVQSNLNYYWEKEEVLEKLDTKMTSAYRAVYDLAKKKNLYMRDAAYVIAINRVAQAVKMRGWA
jgi:glutamate dehydrogenase (NAD(P)+)